ncbi:MAG: ATP-binding protein [Candidatus Rokubacteria bacterium]|nr:ATP-binding protein [Candidatus Rokubacteria bacterium]
MIARIDALGYRCLRYTTQDLQPFHVLVGPNASGKTTFLDTLEFVSDVVLLNPLDAVAHRAPDVRDLVWMRQGDKFEIAIEVRVPDERKKSLKQPIHTARYELSVGQDSESNEFVILGETFWLIAEEELPRQPPPQRTLFPQPPSPPTTIIRPSGSRAPQGWMKIVNKVAESGNDYFSSETSGWNNLFRLGPHKSALANLPEDETKFPVATWFKEFLMAGVRTIALHSDRMRRPSPPGAPRFFLPDGSNLPWVVEGFAQKDPERFQDWIRHIRTALPEIRSVSTVVREEDRHRYLVIEYESGLRAPSWLVSDGTLRLLALSLLAYLPDLEGVFMIEEPENGIHPRAVETVFQSLSSVYGAQVLLATHSPVILSLAKPEQVLCFAKTEDGATDIVSGSDHPRLRTWRGETDLGTLFASGVLG